MSKVDRSTHGVRVVAVMEAAKGALVVLAGFGLLGLMHDGLARLADELVGHLHLNPASHYPRIFLQLANEVSNRQLWSFAAAAFAYTALRWTEAWGLWRGRRWAEWFSVASGAIYVPFELVEISRGFSVLKLCTLLVNLGVVAYMLYALRVSLRQTE